MKHVRKNNAGIHWAQAKREQHGRAACAYPRALGGERNAADDLIAIIRLRDHLHHRKVISVKDYQVERTGVHLSKKMRIDTRQVHQ